MLRVLSFGGGVNSAALLSLAAKGEIEIDFAVMADPGDEQPETYTHLENVIKPFCCKYDIPLSVIKSPLLTKTPDIKTMYDYYYSRRCIPTRRNRDCTDKFKKRVIRSWLIKNYPLAEIELFIGYCKGEEERQANNECQSTAPLIEMGIDRDGCIQIIRDAKLPIPVKSGCYYCIYQSQKSWLNLLVNHPDLYAKSEALEKNCSRYPEMFLAFPQVGRLEVLRKTFEAAQKQGYAQTKEFLQKSLFSQMPKSPSCPMCELEDNADLLGGCFA